MKRKLFLVSLATVAPLVLVCLALVSAAASRTVDTSASEETALRGLALACIQPGECAGVMADANAVWGYHWDRSEAYLSNCPGYMAMCQTNVPTSTCVGWVQAHPEVPVLIGNEPSDVHQDNLGPSLTSAKQAELVLAIYSVNPSAEVYILGIHQHDYFDGVRWWTWKEYADEFAANWPSGLSVTGIHWHYYKWGETAADVAAFNSQMDEYLAWTNTHFPGAENLLSEFGIIGFGTEGVTITETKHFMREAIIRLNADFQGYAWFPYKDCEGLNYPVKPLSSGLTVTYGIDWRNKHYIPFVSAAITETE